MKTKILFYISLIAVAFTACNEEVFLENHSGTIKNGLNIEIVDQYSENTTRANYSGFPATTFEQGDSIGIYAFDGTSYVASNVKFVKQADGTWLSDEEVAYSDDMTYYAYFPYRSTTYTPSTAGTVNDIDTKFASFISDANNYFWKADQSTKDGYTYSNLMIAKGVVTMENDDPVVKFTMLHKRGLALFVDDAELVEFNGNLPYKIGDTLQFLMKPNVLTNFEYDNEACSLTASNGGYSTHKVVKWYYNLEITAPDDFTYSGGTKTYSVTSYRRNTNNISSPVAWTAQFSEDNGTTWSDTPPSWLTAFTTSGSGGTTPAVNNATVTADVLVDNVETTATEMLKSANPVVDYDLSTKGGTTTRNTANCYIVSAPGTYKLPLVYGNAIKNGSTNTQSYNPSGASSETFLKPFINHAGTGITNPWLKNNGVTPNGAVLVWQDCYPTDPETGDSYSLIKNGSIHIGNAANGEDPDFLYFEITPETIMEGNALIAARVGSTTVWSWHIWVTPREWEISELGNTNYKISKRNIGWVNNGNVYKKGYNGRKLLVKITQDEGQNSEIIAITQRKDEYINVFSWNGRCAQYQWGRKEPFMDDSSPNLYTITGSTTRYYNYTYTATGTTTAYGTIENSIKMPTYTYRNNITNSLSKEGPYQSTKINLWGSPKLYGWDSGYINYTNSGNIGLCIKTIYDPSPIGWKVLDPCLGYYIYQNSTWDGQGTKQGIYLQNEEIHINYKPGNRPYNTGYNYNNSNSANYFSSGIYYNISSYYRVSGFNLSYSSYKFNNVTEVPSCMLSIIPMSEDPVN